MPHDLRSQLSEFVLPDARSNAAFDALLADYRLYHLTFSIVAGLFLAGFTTLAVFSWRRFRRLQRAPWPANRFERFIYVAFTTGAAIVSMLLVLLIGANVSNVIDPMQGFAGAIDGLHNPRSPQSAVLREAFTSWLETGATPLPQPIQTALDQRLAWQRPKAIICALLFLALTASAVWIWRKMIRLSREQQGARRPSILALLAAGIATNGVCLLLMLMVLGNVQASIAPLSLTLFYS